jgi:hypothetical protein
MATRSWSRSRRKTVKLGSTAPAGNYLSDNARVVERYTPMSPNHLQYEATIEDATLFSRPWTIRMPLYRIVDDDYRLLEFKCEPFAEEKLYGHLRKPSAVTTEGANR